MKEIIDLIRAYEDAKEAHSKIQEILHGKDVVIGGDANFGIRLYSTDVEGVDGVFAKGCNAFYGCIASACDTLRHDIAKEAARIADKELSEAALNMKVVVDKIVSETTKIQQDGGGV